MISADKNVLVYLLIFGGFGTVLLRMYREWDPPGGKWRVGSWVDTLSILFGKPDPPEESDEDVDG